VNATSDLCVSLPKTNCLSGKTSGILDAPLRVCRSGTQWSVGVLVGDPLVTDSASKHTLFLILVWLAPSFLYLFSVFVYFDLMSMDPATTVNYGYSPTL
jgi:hypothetical protein